MKNRWKYQKRTEETKESFVLECGMEGSITVFLAFVFLLLLALTGTMLDSGRYFGAGGYVSISAHAAGMSTFGSFNRELYEEYHLLGYGGYLRHTAEDWKEEFLDILADNLAAAPAEGGRPYSAIYGIQDLNVQIDKWKCLTDRDILQEQMEKWLETTTVHDLTEALLGYLDGRTGFMSQGPMDSLEQAKQMEENEIAENEMEQEEVAQSEVSGQDVGDSNKNTAGGNPLVFLKEFVQDGILGMVCEPGELSVECINPVGSSNSFSPSEEDGAEEKIPGNTAGEILTGMLKGSPQIWDLKKIEKGNRKGTLLLYDTKVFGDYVSSRNRSMAYESEYLIMGNQRDKDNLSGIVDRLLMIRMLMNYTYLHADQAILEKSMATAASIAAAFQNPALIKAVQETILLILALEEGCVDVRALLEGRSVPFAKTASSFQMQYEEICMGNPELFARKAKEFPVGSRKISIDRLKQGMEYYHYLWLMMLMTPEDLLWSRTMDLIQNDLQKRYNSAFTLGECICGAEGSVCYSMPFLFRIFWGKAAPQKEASGGLERKISFQYAYQ